MRIGIFDSGIGGLSVLHHAMKQMPDTEFIYYADKAHVPYGEKTIEEIQGFVKEILDFLLDKGVDAIVIACNTATSVATREFRDSYPVPIVGMEPAVKKAVEWYQHTGKRILVAATPVTIAGDKLHHLLERVDREKEVDLLPLPKLVRFAEAGEFESQDVEDYLREAVQDLEVEDYIAIVLGCTHFNYFKESFRKVFSQDIHFVDGNEGTINQLIRVASDGENLGTTGKVSYYYSGEEVTEAEKLKIEDYLRQLDKVYTY